MAPKTAADAAREGTAELCSVDDDDELILGISSRKVVSREREGGTFDEQKPIIYR